MSKPGWLKDKEAAVEHLERKEVLCRGCAYFGPIVDWTRHLGKERTEVHECDVHPKCFNTIYSVCCEDWTPAELL